MSRDVPFAVPSLDESDVAAVVSVLERGWISTGSEATAFEEEFSAYVGSRHAVAVSSCTAALHLALLALGVGEGDEVLVPAVTFTATASAVVHAGAVPVLVDVEPASLLLSTESALSALTPATKAVVPVHFSGRMVPPAELRELAGDAGIAVVEDAAHALPAHRDGVGVGRCGTVSAFSFFATKPITTAEGGMLCTDDPAIEHAARVWSLHGISREAVGRYAPGGSAHYEVFHPGYKYNLSDLQASLGRSQLAKCDALYERRRAIAETYLRDLADVDGLDLPPPDTAADVSAWYLFVVQLRLDELTVDRDAFCAELADRGVGTSVHFKPLHLYQAWSGAPRARSMAVAEAAFPRLVSLPIYPTMDDADVAHVVEAVAGACAAFRR